MLLVRTYLAPSPIEGIGCFAKVKIARGMPVWRFMPCFDVVLPSRFPRLSGGFALPEFFERYGQLCPQTGFWLLCSDDARFINHADEPALTSFVVAGEPWCGHDAARDIAAGEEITCDYRIGDAAPFAGFAARGG